MLLGARLREALEGVLADAEEEKRRAEDGPVTTAGGAPGFRHERGQRPGTLGARRRACPML